MFPDIALASWSHYHFRIIVDASRFLIQRFQTHCPPCKIKIDAEVSQEITTEYTALREACGLVNRFQVEHRSADLLESTQTKTQSRQLQQLHIFRHTRSTKHTHLRRLQQIEKLFLLRKFFRYHRNAGCCIDNEIDVLFESFEPNFTTQESTRRRS